LHIPFAYTLNDCSKINAKTGNDKKNFILPMSRTTHAIAAMINVFINHKPW
jgi:hypothetical protein